MPALIAFLVALSLVASAGEVIDLTEAAADQAEWKIVESRSGGPIGTAPMPPSHKPVTLRLVQVFKSGEHLYFSIEINNDREVGLQVPVSLSSAALDKPEQVIRFRELLVSLGTVADARTSFKYAPSIKPVSLFGNRSIPGTIEVLSPGQKITLRLKTQIHDEGAYDLSKLRARIGAWDVELAPVPGGYKRSSTRILSLSATSTAD